MLPFSVAASVLAAAGLEDGVQIEDILIFCAGGITVITFVLLIGKLPFWRSIRRSWQRFQRFQDDWEGVPGDDGHSAIPGVMQRLNRIDGEFQRNGGQSMKDALVAVAVAAEDYGKRLDDLVTEIRDVKATVESMTVDSRGTNDIDNRIRNRHEETKQ